MFVDILVYFCIFERVHEINNTLMSSVYVFMLSNCKLAVGDAREHSPSLLFLAAIAALYLTMSVGWSVGLLVCQ